MTRADANRLIREHHGRDWPALSASCPRWTQREIDDLKRILGAGAVGPAVAWAAADCIGSLEFDLVDARRDTK